MPFLAPVVAAWGAFAAANAVAAFAIKTVVGIGISYGLSKISQALAPKPQAGEPLSGTEFSVQIGGDIAYQIPIGQVLVRGHLIYHNTNGNKNQYHQQVFVLGDWPCEGLQHVVMDGKVYTITELNSGAGWIRYELNGYADQCLIHFWDGTQTVADGDLIAAANPSGKWSANSVVTGKCYVAVFWTYKKPTESTTDFDLFEAGVPELGFVIKGARLYDWRLDSTNNGVGPHRWNDPATWEYSENPIVALYNFQRGFFHPGSGEKLLGMAVPSFDLSHPHYTAAANVCEETVIRDESEGGVEDRYRCAIILTADKDVPFSQTIEALLSTCAGYLYDTNGITIAEAGAAKSVSKIITDGDLVIGQPVRYAAKRSRSDLVNTIHGQFLDPAVNYEPSSYGAWADAGAALNDGEELGRALDLFAVPSKGQAERIAKIRGREVRAQKTAAITVGFNHVDLVAGDWITWNSARFGATTYRIVEREVDPETRTVSMELAEINAAVFSWFAADETPALNTPVDLERGSRLQAPINFTVQPDSEIAPDGRERPALAFGWVSIDDPTVDAVIIQYRRADDPSVVYVLRDDSPEDGAAKTTNGVVGGADYEARASLRTTPARAIVWTPWSDMVTSSNEVIISQLSAQINFELGQITSLAQGTIRSQLEQSRLLLEQIAVNTAEGMLIDEEARKRVVRQIIVVRDDISASITELEQTLVGADTALAQQLTVLNASLTELQATVTVDRQARIEGDTVTAATATTALARANQATASGLIELAATVAPAGVTSRFAVYLKTEVGGILRDTGFWLDILPDGTSRALIKTDKFAITDGTSTIVPFIVTGGVAYIDNLVARNIGADTISTLQLIVGGVLTENVGSEQITRIASQDDYDVPDFNVTEGGSAVIVTSCTVKVDGGSVFTNGQIYWNSTEIRGDSTYFDFYRGSSLLEPNMVRDLEENQWFPFQHTDGSPGVGIVTYTLRARYVNPGEAGAVVSLSVPHKLQFSFSRSA